MRKLILLSIVCFSFINNSFSQNNYNWITPNKTYLKLLITDDGIYRINSIDFTNAGINPSTIDPRTIKVLYKGNQLPIYFEGEDDGIFNPNDFFDFFGNRNYGGLTPHLDGFSNSVVYTTDEYYNFYSDTNAYWIDWGGSNGARMPKSSYVSSVNYPDNNFYKKVHFERDNFYYLGETLNPSNDFRYFSTELVVGEAWFWKEISTNEFLTDTVFINDLSPSAQLCSLNLFVKPVSFTDSVFNEHRLEIKINNTVYDTLFRDGLAKFDTTIIFPASLLSNNSTNSITMRYIPLGNQYFLPKIHIDFFNLYYQRDFIIRNNELAVNLTGTDTTSKKFTLSGYNSGNPLNIYDTENNIRIENYSGNLNNLTFTGRGNSKFRIVNNNITKKPYKIISRQVKDLASVSNSADYLIIYNKVFESQSEQLKNHRQAFDNFNVIKAEMQDIYDIFNYGIESPVALRNFVKYAYENWSSPKVNFVCLFGRASLDPKKNSSGSVYYQNFVPTYGNPPSDGYFVNFNIGTFTYYHQISIGRLPVYTTAEAQGVVDKIVNYDTQQPEKWWKNFIAITGGSKRNEQLTFQSKSDYLINTYIKPPPVSMQVAKIYRNDSAGYITYNYRDSIKKEIDRGSQIINFIGHAANQDWEIGLENPNTLNNGNRQPLVLSFTCYTGKCSEPNERSFGEHFFLPAGKCAIAFLGTTGWSFSGAGDAYNEHVLKSFSKDSTRKIGELVTYANKVMSRDSGNFNYRNTINSYNLIGDPASTLLLPRTPEFEIKQNDYALSNYFPALGEQIKLSIYPKNLGTYVDTVRVRYQLKKNGVTSQRKDTLITTFGYIDTMAYFFKVDTSGNYTMTIAIDPNKSYPQRYTLNDSITFPLTLRNLSYVPVKPLDNSLLNTASFRFTGLNPNVNLNTNSVKVILEIDTSITFNSPVIQIYNSNNVTGISTSFNVNIPVQNANTLYFFRTNAIINNDSSGWSVIQRAIYNPGISDKFESAADSAYTIYSLKPEQFDENEIKNLIHTPTGFSIGTINGSLTARSLGSSGPEASFFIINNGVSNITYYSDAGENVGLNIAKVKKLNGSVSSIKNFRMNSPQSSDSVLNYLNTFQTTDYIMGYICSYVANADSLRPNVLNKFKEFGSYYLDSVTLDFFDTWSFIGYLGADSTQVCEKYHHFASNNVWTSLLCEITPSFKPVTGSISQTFGIADKWKNFSWDQILAPNSSITFDVIGIGRDNVPVMLSSGLSNNSMINIDTIDFYTYPNLKLTANLSIDTLQGLESPEFHSINFKYYPPAELVPDNYSFTGGDTLVQEGDSIQFSVKYYNVGYIDAGQHINRWYITHNNAQLILRQDTINTPLKIDSMQSSFVKFSTSGLRDRKTPKDTINLFFETELTGNRNELFPFNNTAVTKFILEGDTARPVIDITYDGIKIQNGDFIQSKPEIVLKFYDDSRMVINDTSNVKVYLDNKYIPYYLNGMPNPLITISFPDEKFLQATVVYKPVLQEGNHKFKYVSTDVTGNLSDSVVNTVVVNNKLSISEIANYPNPMKTETAFMFMLSGELNPTSCKVKIYTVAGRLVKEINVPAKIGYNIIHWDGRDNDGDYIANGTYLYKFIIQGNSQTETSIQKLAVLR